MTSPRIEVDLDKIRHNANTLVNRLKHRRIDVTGVTKGVCGHPAIAQAMLDGGVSGLADARISNIRRLRKAGFICPISLIRTPLMSQSKIVVQICDVSYNTEIDVIAGLSRAALRAGKIHNIILMVEMGDLREGIIPANAVSIALQVAKMKGVALKGVAANFACLGSQAPDDQKMRILSDISDEVERQCGSVLEVISGGNSASLPWAIASGMAGRTNDLRLGEAILLGIDPLSGKQIGGLFKDAISLVAEVIESKAKSGAILGDLWGSPSSKIRLATDKDAGTRSILAIGMQDTDISGLTMPPGAKFMGATSDHMVVLTANSEFGVGAEMRFALSYNALARAMAAPDIAKKMQKQSGQEFDDGTQGAKPHLALV